MKALNSVPSRFHENLEDDNSFDDVGSLVRGPALTLSETAPVAEARRLLAKYRVAAIAVINDSDDLRGLITRTDVLRTDDLTKPVSELMCMFIFALPSSASVYRAASLIACEGVGQVVVTGPDQSLLGIVSAVDILRYFAVDTRAQAG
jgi:signal-transduction protein with cAMP-binding, CBS, and nucleotidyltransferase domain